MNVSELRLYIHFKYVQQKLYCYFIKVITQFASSLIIHTKGKLYTYISFHLNYCYNNNNKSWFRFEYHAFHFLKIFLSFLCALVNIYLEVCMMKKKK